MAVGCLGATLEDLWARKSVKSKSAGLGRGSKRHRAREPCGKAAECD
jgi:hypothetical protein